MFLSILKFGELSIGASSDDLVQMQNDDEDTDDAEVSIGTEIPDHEQIGDIPSHQLIPHDNDDDHGNLLLHFKT